MYNPLCLEHNLVGQALVGNPLCLGHDFAEQALLGTFSRSQLPPVVATGAHSDSQHAVTSLVHRVLNCQAHSLHTYALIYPPFQITLQRWCNHTHCDEVHFIFNLSFTAW